LQSVRQRSFFFIVKRNENIFHLRLHSSPTVNPFPPERKSAMVQVQETAIEQSVGVKMMDRDHVEISEMVLELNLEAAAGKPWDRTGRLLKEMSRALVSHFELEQTMMEATRYPGLTLHRLRHEWMIDQMRILTARCKQDGVASNQILLEMLSESHFEHMQTEDLGYGLWLNADMRRPEHATTGMYSGLHQGTDVTDGARAPRPLIYVEPGAPMELAGVGRNSASARSC
jgi:hemerythrin-like metal-binding protein